MGRISFGVRVAMVAFWIIGTCTTVSAVEKVSLRIATGGKLGTYYAVATDIQKIAGENGLEIEVLESQGSVHNYEILASRGADLAIMQSDAMGFIQGIHPEAPDHLRVIMALYKEELHLLANRRIRTVSDLMRKRLALGKFGSGTCISTNHVLSVNYIGDVDKKFDMTYTEAVKLLLVDTIDAMSLVAGKPSPIFKKLEAAVADPNMGKLLQRIHFVPVTNKKLFDKYYVPSTIGPEDYSWVEAPVPTVAVKAMLVHYHPRGPVSGAHDVRDVKIANLYQIITANFDRLQQTGHPKWKEVDLKAPTIKGWKTDPAIHFNVDTKKINTLFD